MIYAEESFGNCAEFITKYVNEHKKNFDEDNIKDLTDLMINENRKTTDKTSSFYDSFTSFHTHVNHIKQVQNCTISIKF